MLKPSPSVSTRPAVFRGTNEPLFHSLACFPAVSLACTLHITEDPDQSTNILTARRNSEAFQWKTDIYYLNCRPEAALKLHQIEMNLEGSLR